MNPFRDKARRARERPDALNRPSAHDAAMAQAFPLGAGFGRPGAARRIDASVTRAVDAVAAEQRARMLEAQADAFDRGEINAQGRAINAASKARSEKRETAAVRRRERIERAQQERGDRPAWQVPAEVWADAAGYLAGSGRALVLADHAAAVERAKAEGHIIPEENR